MVALTPSATAALTSLAESFIKEGVVNPKVVSYQDTSYVIKFTRREKGRLWREWVNSLACTLFFQVIAKPWQLKTGNIGFEAERLKELKLAGVAVPQVYFYTDQYLVMEHTGTPLPNVLQENPAETNALVTELVNSLIQLHLAGQWHGGTQVRNYTYKNNQIYRIDFEERIGEALPLPLAQAFDVFQLFNSLATFLNYDSQLGASYLNTYLQAIANPKVQGYLSKLNSYLKFLRKIKIEALLSKKQLNSKDVKSFLYFSDVLNLSLKNRL